MNWQTVKSSNVDAVSYDPGTKILSVRFRGSGVYHYKDIPQEIVDGMMIAKSVGKFFIENIKGKYEVEKETRACPKCQGEMKIGKGTGPIPYLWECMCGFYEPVS